MRKRILSYARELLGLDRNAHACVCALEYARAPTEAPAVTKSRLSLGLRKRLKRLVENLWRTRKRAGIECNMSAGQKLIVMLV